MVVEERVRLQGYLKGTLNYRYGLVEEKLLNPEGNTCGRMDSLEINCFSNVILNELRNGKNISFWMDFWLGEQPFNLNFLVMYIHSNLFMIRFLVLC